jgi:ATP-dependent RNA helicase HelY
MVVSNRDGKATVVTQDRQSFRASAKDFDEAPTVLTRVALPRSGSPGSARYRRDVAAKLVTLHVTQPRPARPRVTAKVEREAAELEALAAAHPCHHCPDLGRHERWARRAGELERRLRGVDRRIRTRTETLARQFDRVLAVLEALGYVREFEIQPKGRALARIYGEGDLLVGEALAEGVFDGLEPAEVASLVSTLVYESRERVPAPGALPTAASADRYRRLQGIWTRVRSTEDDHQVQLCRELDNGFATPVFHWAEGKPLEDVLAETEMAPGDFVRNCKQLIDLLRQIEDVAEPETAGLVRRARDAVRRGVVAYTGV